MYYVSGCHLVLRDNGWPTVIRSLTIIKAFGRLVSNGHHGRHYLDIGRTFIKFNSFANSSKTVFAII